MVGAPEKIAATRATPLGSWRSLELRQAGLKLTELIENFQCSRCLSGVDAAHGKADVHQHPTPDVVLGHGARCYYTGEIDLASHTQDVDCSQLVLGNGDGDDSSGNSQAHGAYRFLAAQTTACPRL